MRNDTLRVENNFHLETTHDSYFSFCKLSQFIYIAKIELVKLTISDWNWAQNIWKIRWQLFQN